MTTLLNLLELSSMKFYRFFLFVVSLFITSCGIPSIEVEVDYFIKEMNDSNFDVTFTVKNSTDFDFDSTWSLHWNQQSSTVNGESVPDNLKFEYVAGQSYNIL